MRIVVPMRRAAALTVIALGAACDSKKRGPTSPAPPPQPNFVQLQSAAGDNIGAGGSYSYSNKTAAITVTANEGQLTIKIVGDEFWDGLFLLPASANQIKRGSYRDVNTLYPQQDRTKPGLSWTGEGRGCSPIAGSFDVDSVTYTGTQLRAVDVRFEQRCGTQAGAPLQGTIHWRSDDTTKAPGPVSVPGGLWQPPSGAIPPTGNYLYLQSDVGDFVGSGRSYMYTPSNAAIGVIAFGGRLTVSGGGWTGVVQTMNSIGELRAGYYPDVRRWPFHNPARGGLDWTSNNRGCNKIRGWFAIDKVTYVADAITSIELRFEQHCDNDTPALRGALRWDK